jgi:NAD(P)-dependent dehydrogenase (short-subunit alcohol dehydrogenase family)
MRFADKVAFITGGGNGIGVAYATAFAQEGAAAVIADVDVDAAKAVAARIVAAGGRAIAVDCDVADEDSVAAAVAVAVGEFGGVDILINNAARHLMRYNVPATQLSREMWRGMLDVNVVGIVNCAASCRPSMEARGAGSIVNISSMAGFASVNAYGVSKLAVRGLTVALAHEFGGTGIQVNGIAPGLFESEGVLTEMTEERRRFVVSQQLIKRKGEMSDLVGAVFFLCSPEASFITGETLIVSGGAALRP